MTQQRCWPSTPIKANRSELLPEHLLALTILGPLRILITVLLIEIFAFSILLEQRRQQFQQQKRKAAKRRRSGDRRRSLAGDQD